MMRALLLALALWCGGVAAACAHASLIASEPADGAMLPQAPAVVSLTFNEPVSPNVLRLVTPQGQTVPLSAAARGDGATLAVTLPALGEGTHLMSWRVISADGHPVGGTLTFSVGRASAAPGISEPASWPLRAGIALTRFALYLGLFAGIGGAFFAAWIAPLGAAARRSIRAMLYLGLAAAGPALAFQGLDSLGAPFSQVFDTGVWRAALTSTYALTLAVAVAALLLALVAHGRDGRFARPLAAAALAGVGLALALSGHASTAPPQWLTRPAVAIHAVCVAIWAGSLLPLWRAMREPADSRPALLRFSTLIPTPFLLLIASGAVLAVIQTRWFADLWQFAYGRILIAKLGVVGVLIVIAAVNRLWLTPRVAADDPGARRLLGCTILTEIALVAGILGLITLWRFTPPPRALAAAEPAFVHLHAGIAMADLTLTPGRAGGALFADIRLMREDFSPLPAREVHLTLANKAAGIEPIARDGHRQADGSWRVSGLVAPIPGRWEVNISVLISDFDRITLDGPVVLQP